MSRKLFDYYTTCNSCDKENRVLIKHLVNTSLHRHNHSNLYSGDVPEVNGMGKDTR